MYALCHNSLICIVRKASHLAVVPRCGTRGTYLSLLDCRGICGLETSPCRWDANSVVEFLRFFVSPTPAVRAIYGISIYLLSRCGLLFKIVFAPVNLLFRYRVLLGC